jgi:hypothetical protein
MAAVEALGACGLAPRRWWSGVQLRRVDAKGSQQVSVAHAAPLLSASATVRRPMVLKGPA